MQCGERPRARRSGRRSRASEAGTRHGLMGNCSVLKGDWVQARWRPPRPRGFPRGFYASSRVRAPSSSVTPIAESWALCEDYWPVAGRAGQTREYLPATPAPSSGSLGRQRNPCLGPRGHPAFRPVSSSQQIQPLVKPGDGPGDRNTVKGSEQKKARFETLYSNDPQAWPSPWSQAPPHSLPGWSAVVGERMQQTSAVSWGI